MAGWEDWSIRHPVVAVALAGTAAGLISLLAGEWVRAGLLAAFGATVQGLIVRSELVAFRRGGMDEVRRLRRRRSVIGVALVVLLVIAVVAFILLA